MTRGEIWWAQFGIPFGSEAGYRRPVLIVQDDSFNESRIETIVVLPLTTNMNREDDRGNVVVKRSESKLSADSVIMVPQLYAIDRKRLLERVSKVSQDTMKKVETGISQVLGIK